MPARSLRVTRSHTSASAPTCARSSASSASLRDESTPAVFARSLWQVMQYCPRSAPAAAGVETSSADGVDAALRAGSGPDALCPETVTPTAVATSARVPTTRALGVMNRLLISRTSQVTSARRPAPDAVFYSREQR